MAREVILLGRTVAGDLRLTLHGSKQHDQRIEEIIGEDLQGVAGEVVAEVQRI